MGEVGCEKHLATQGLNALASEMYSIAAEHGFHERALPVAELLANLHGEVSELWEAYRKGQLDEPCDKADKMPEPLTCAEEELADVIIRALDTAATWGIDIEKSIRVKAEFNRTRPYRHGGKVA